MWLNPPLVDIVDFIVTVLFFGLDQEISAFPLRFRIQFEKGFGSFIGVKLNKYAPFENFVNIPTKANRVDRAMGCEVSFDVELCGGFLTTKAFDINGARHGFVLVDFLNFLMTLALDKVFWKRDFALDASIILNNIKDLTLFECIDNCGEWLKMTHAFKGSDCLDRYR